MPEISFVYPYHLPWTAIRPLLVALDDSNAHGVWVYENPRDRGAFAAAGAALSVTARAQVGVGVVTTYLRHREVLAMEAFHARSVGQGRFVLGIGAGTAYEAERLGLDYSSPLKTVREQIMAVRSFESATPPPETWPAQRVFVAATGPRMIELAGRSADGLILSLNAPPAFVRNAAEAAQRAATEAERGRLRIVVYVHAVVANTNEQALDVARKQLETTFHRLAGSSVFRSFAAALPSTLSDELIRASAGDGVEGTGLTDELVRELVCAGTVGDLVARARLAYAAADEVVLLVPRCDDVTFTDLVDSV